uniref:Uncharacterized protein n=1 Tax=Stegastes partitus TaxID=144197 RepID=A0A3B5AF36_9TELE
THSRRKISHHRSMRWFPVLGPKVMLPLSARFSEKIKNHRRKKACREGLSRVQASQQQLRVWTQQGDYNSASFAGSLAIVRNGQPFTNGEYAKTFMLDEASERFDDLPNKDKIIKRIQDMPLSARTDINAAPFFSLALDESTDVSHLSQFSVIARYAAGDTLRKESLAVLPIKGSTRGEDLFKSFMEFAQEKKLPTDKLLSVCTDGAPCMVGKNKGFVALLREHENRPILSSHCMMCDGQLGEVMSLVIRVINFIVARALNDRKFKTLLDEVGNNYHSLPLHSNVCWLSRGKVLSHFAACLNEIRTSLEMKGSEHPELAETEWLLKFYYLVDVTEHLNQLNVKMQGTGNTVLSLQQAVFAFENKLELFIMDLETGRSVHFEKLKQFKDACTASEPTQNFALHQLAGFTSSLLQSFKARFGEFREHTRLFKFITHPNVTFLVSPFGKNRTTESGVGEPADHQNLELPVTYHTLQRVSIAVLAMFGSTYACEQSFSHLKNIKTRIMAMKPGLNPNLSITLQRNLCSTLSNAFSWSSEMRPALLSNELESSKISRIR